MADFADINILERGDSSLVLAWPVDPDSTVASFKLYASTDPTVGYTGLGGLIPNAASGNGYAPRSVVANVIEGATGFPGYTGSVRALGGAFADAEFAFTPLFFRAVAVDSTGTPKDVSTAKTKALQTMATAPSGRLGSIRGAAYTTSNPLNDDNVCIDRTMTGTTGAFYVTEELIYLAGAPTGSRAKKIEYTGPFSVDGKATTVRTSDILLP